MHIPARTLRDTIEDRAGPRPLLTHSDIKHHDEILAAAQACFAKHGRAAFSMAGFATALGVSPATVRRHFCDLDQLLFIILQRHLQRLALAIGAASQHGPPGQRAAYLAATRNGLGAHAERHRLFLSERHALPPDLAAVIDKIHQGIAETLVGCNATQTSMAVLDNLELEPSQIETVLTAIDAVTTAPEAATTPHPAERLKPRISPWARKHAPTRRLSTQARAGPG